MVYEVFETDSIKYQQYEQVWSLTSLTNLFTNLLLILVGNTKSFVEDFKERNVRNGIAKHDK